MSAARIEKLESLLARVQRNRDLPREAAEPKRLPSTPLELAVESAELPLPSDVPPPMDEAVAVAAAVTATPAAGTPRSPSFSKLEIPAAAMDDEPELVVSEASGEFDVDVDDGEDLPTIPPPPDEPVVASPGFKPVELPPAELELAIVAPEPPAPAAPPVAPPVVVPEPPAPVAAAVAAPAVAPVEAAPIAAPVEAAPIAAAPPTASAPVAKVVAAAPVAAPKTFGELLDRTLSLRPR